MLLLLGKPETIDSSCLIKDNASFLFHCDIAFWITVQSFISFSTLEIISCSDCESFFPIFILFAISDIIHFAFQYNFRTSVIIVGLVITYHMIIHGTPHEVNQNIDPAAHCIYVHTDLHFIYSMSSRDFTALIFSEIHGTSCSTRASFFSFHLFVRLDSLLIALSFKSHVLESIKSVFNCFSSNSCGLYCASKTQSSGICCLALSSNNLRSDCAVNFDCAVFHSCQIHILSSCFLIFNTSSAV